MGKRSTTGERKTAGRTPKARRGEDPGIREDGLQLDEPRRVQERIWTAERWAWVSFGLIVLAALAGLTGSGGPLAHQETRLDGGRLDYPRITRWQSTDDMTLQLAAGPAERRLTLSREFAEAFTIKDIQPAPERAKAVPDGQRLVFRLPDGAPAQIRLYLRPSTPGLVRFRAALDESAPASLSILVLP